MCDCTLRNENTFTTPHNCRTCGGRGVITVYTEVRMDSFGAFGVGAHQVNCPDCSSFETGMVYNRPMTREDENTLTTPHNCRTCGGRGVITVYTEVRMDSFGAFGVGAHQVNCPDCNGSFAEMGKLIPVASQTAVTIVAAS